MSDSGNAQLGEWLDCELTAVPNELALRLRSALPTGWRTLSLESGATVLADAAATELTRLLERGCETRSAAPGLLTADALVTYACQLLAVSGANIDAGAADILDRIASVMPPTDSAA